MKRLFILLLFCLGGSCLGTKSAELPREIWKSNGITLEQFEDHERDNLITKIAQEPLETPRIAYTTGIMGAGKTTKEIQDIYQCLTYGVKIDDGTIPAEQLLIISLVAAITNRRAIDARGWMNLEVSGNFDNNTDFTNLIDSLQSQASERTLVLFIDEAQFLVPDQISQLFALSQKNQAIIRLYGLMEDYKRKLWSAFEKVQELGIPVNKLKGPCCRFCEHDDAVVSARLENRKNGWCVNTGETEQQESSVKVEDQDTVYFPLCGQCWKNPASVSPENLSKVMKFTGQRVFGSS